MGDNTKLYSWNLFPVPRALIGYYEEVIKIFKRATLLKSVTFPASDSLRWGIWNILYIKSCGMKSNDSFDFIPAVLIWFISCTSFTFISFTGTYKHITDQLPTSVASLLSWLEYRTGIARLQVQIPLKLLNFFSGFLRNCINCVHNCEDPSSIDFISIVLIWFISCTSFTVLNVSMKEHTKTDREIISRKILFRNP